MIELPEKMSEIYNVRNNLKMSVIMSEIITLCQGTVYGTIKFGTFIGHWCGTGTQVVFYPEGL